MRLCRFPPGIPLAILGCLAMQAQMPGGAVSGTVTDPTGASVPQAVLVLTHTPTARARTLTTNREGFFTASNLLAGEYEITASAGGFEKQVVQFRLNAGAQAEVNFELRVGPIDQFIEVGPPTWVIAIALGLFLIIGLVTPVVSFLATLEAAGMLFAIFQGELPGGLVSKLYCILLAGSSAALVLLGPGAFSVDARWFGWREIIVTPRPQEDSGSESD